MNMTGLRACRRGSSFGNESRTAATTRSRENIPGRLSPLRGGGDGGWLFEVDRHLLASQPVESEVELEDVDAGLAEEVERAAFRVLGGSAARTVASGRCRTAATRRAWRLGVGDRDLGVDARAGRHDGVDGDLVDRQAGVVRALRA